MTDLRELLEVVAGEPSGPTPDVVASDLRRGRTALRRRRSLLATSGVILAVAAIALGVAVLPKLAAGDGAGNTSAVPGGASAVDGVPLVPWDGGGAAKPISPSLVPEGWTVSGSKSALVISQPGVTTSPDDFGGKLVAMLSGDTTPAPDGQPVTIGSAEGTISREGNTMILILRYGDGRTLDVQAPQSLGWTTAMLVEFAAGLSIAPDAPAGLG